MTAIAAATGGAWRTTDGDIATLQRGQFLDEAFTGNLQFGQSNSAMADSGYRADR